MFEYLLNTYENLATTFEAVDFEAYDAPEDHLAINVRAATYKLADYYAKLDESPYYFIATLLHPYYKTYCDNAWRDKDEWLAAGLMIRKYVVALMVTCRGACEEIRMRDDAVQPEGSSMRDVANIVGW